MRISISGSLMNSVAPVWAPEGEGGGSTTTTTTETPSTETILFGASEAADKAATTTTTTTEELGEDGKPKPPAGDTDAEKDAAAKAAAEAEAAKDKDAKPEWKEYEPDPNKTDEENAALKAEHDKTKPEADEFVIPEKYELTLPEGMPLDGELLEAVTPVFKDLMLTNDQAQALTDKFVEHMAAKNEQTMTAWAETLDSWVEKAQKDPEIGGDNWEQTKAMSQLAVNKLGTPELKTYLQRSGGGNHPELIRIFAKIGPLLKEDDPANGGEGGGGKPVALENVLFPNG